MCACQKELSKVVKHQEELGKLKTQIRELHTHLWVMPVNIKLDGFASRKSAGKDWSSHPFYTHLRGYKICLSVCCNGDQNGAGTHVSVYMFLKSGEYDDELNWPFHRSITVRLVDQKEGNKHHDDTVRFSAAPDVCTKRRVEMGGGYSSWGSPRFISHSKLFPKYLVNDSLRFSIF